MNIIISPDSFKGTLSAKQAAHAMAEGIHSVFPEATCTLLPVADGGEGTLEVLVDLTQGRFIQIPVTDPLGRTIHARYGILGDQQTAVIEMAEASGIMHVAKDERDPFRATTFGTGEMIRHALDQGCRRFIVAIGGSATNDGGIGMMRALGADFYAEETALSDYLPDYMNLTHIDLTQFDSRISACDFSIACDVDNPLLGDRGATAIFGPQKGVTAEHAETLEAVLACLAQRIEELTGRAHHERAGAGAAGGLGTALLAFFPAHLERGIDSVLDACHFQDYLKDADIVMTGEGKSDVQTLSGKAPLGIAERATAAGVPVALLSGMIPMEERELLAPHFTYMESIVSEECSVEVALTEPHASLVSAAARLAVKLTLF